VTGASASRPQFGRGAPALADGGAKLRGISDIRRDGKKMREGSLPQEILGGSRWER
jgi:hypothetical protein